MKLGREQLKRLIKECIVEVLSEGIGGHLVEQIRTPPVARKPVRNLVLDTPVKQPHRASPALVEAIKVEARGNPIMADILADTAATTLPEQIAAGMDGASRHSVDVGPVLDESPEELFGDEAASKWAELAFAPSKRVS